MWAGFVKSMMPPKKGVPRKSNGAFAKPEDDAGIDYAHVHLPLPGQDDSDPDSVEIDGLVGTSFDGLPPPCGGF